MEPRVLWGTTAIVSGYMVLATWSAVWLGSRLLEPVARWVAVGGTADEFEDLIVALRRVELGQLDARVRVWDSTELGVLQAGFNAMAHGLEDRERVRELFGRHVGEEVAAAAVRASPSFDGEVRNVAVRFLDLVGSTSMAETTDPRDVIRLFNTFFEIVIDVIHDHEGWINKFQGDAALACLGSPLDVADYGLRALQASRALEDRLRAELPDVPVGIGVSAGPVVTGNVGAARRYEYTVLGDAVNEAARLTDLAKERRCGVVVSAAPVERVGSPRRTGGSRSNR